MSLFQESGGDANSRRNEATKIVDMLVGLTDQMTDREQGFIEQIGDPNAQVSPKQLFWLRDIKEKYL